MATIMTGYQWGPSGAYIGPYDFPKNEDREEVHLPPNTTLDAPPDGIPDGQEAAWDGDAWILRDKVSP